MKGGDMDLQGSLSAVAASSPPSSYLKMFKLPVQELLPHYAETSQHQERQREAASPEGAVGALLQFILESRSRGGGLVLAT